MTKNGTETRLRLVEEAIKVINHNTTDINSRIDKFEASINSNNERLTKIETTMGNLKWFIPIGVGVAMFLAQLGLKLLGI